LCRVGCAIRHQSEILDEPGSSQESREWVAALNGAGVPAGPINNIEQAIQLAERLKLGPIITIKDSRDGSTSKTIANPITFSETPVIYRYGPPSLGMDD
jgi:crotonobetainyl-CoA:carnitine CoA-transferase CaiB-like acyl-CoA transferase